MGKKGFFSFLVVAAVGFAIYFAITSEIHRLQRQTSSKKENIINNTVPMQLISQAFSSNQEMPQKYTCEGEGVNPPLVFQDVPADTKSLAMIVDDPDAPSGDWVHWLLWNIDPATKGIAENSVPPEAIAGMTDFGQRQYGAPCPPTGSHRYFFKLYALDAKLQLSSFSDKPALEKAMEGHVLAKAQTVGTYKKVSRVLEE